MHKKFQAGWLALALALTAGGMAPAQATTLLAEPTAAIQPDTALSDGPSALSTLRAYAEMGHILAQYQLAQRHYSGDGVPRDLALAAMWYQRAADAGEPRSQLALAQLYAKGEGVARSERWAAYWIRQAAESGFREAQLQLGRLYERGQGVSKDEAEAYFWYCLASDGGWSGDDALRERERLGPQLTHVQRTSARYAAFHWRPRNSTGTH
ncbi:MAG: tetratricopeptide repeat protein [Giesbergeria sp.]|uniref:tetratricopeptide repeat protein n=1 Tax=Giesbergeria sp. TaxID=2818473 RepID=UPI00260CE914|nr:tetratricopeptide repeat protein [Giesbergeria sp.]MDD2608200.1 tetratricopeptide repeat protein [Giesbergeria sp.]